MAKLLLFKLICCLAAMVNGAAVQDKNISIRQEKLKGKIHGNSGASQHKVAREAGSSLFYSSPSPTKFGFVPTRTASSYAAKAPRPNNFQHAYKVKEKREPSGFQSEYHGQQKLRDPPTYAAQEIPYQAGQHVSQPIPYLQPQLDTAEYSQHQTQPDQQYYQQLHGVPQYHPQQHPTNREYRQYETVQYVTDNNIAQSTGHQYQSDEGSAAPQYYYVQPQESGSAEESVVDSKGGIQYVTYVQDSPLAQYSQNAILSDIKYQNFAEYQAPITTTKYSSTSPSKFTTAKVSLPNSSANYGKQQEYQYVTSKVPASYEKAPEYQYLSPANYEKTPNNEYQYVTSKIPSSYQKAPEYQHVDYQNYHNNYHQPKEIIIKRHPKSLLDSYIPSVVQLRWLEQQKHAKHYHSS